MALCVIVSGVEALRWESLPAHHFVDGGPRCVPSARELKTIESLIIAPLMYCVNGHAETISDVGQGHSFTCLIHGGASQFVIPRAVHVRTYVVSGRQPHRTAG